MFQKTIQLLEYELIQIISQSEVPEDLIHAKNVKEWVQKIYPQASTALKIAALAHDIERAFPDKKVQRKDYTDFNAFKKAHACNSAQIALEILDPYHLNETFKSRVIFLIENHEFGKPGDEELLALKEADAVSFFEVNLPFYFQRNTKKETYFRMQWGFERLSERGKKLVINFHYPERTLHILFKRCLEQNHR